MPAVTVRPMSPGDLPRCRELWNSVVRDGIAFPQTDELSGTEAAEFLAAQSAVGVAELEDGLVVGLYILHPNNVGRCGHIANASYAVDPGMRGMHIGEADPGVLRDRQKLAKDGIVTCVCAISSRSHRIMEVDMSARGTSFMDDIEMFEQAEVAVREAVAQANVDGAIGVDTIRKTVRSSLLKFLWANTHTRPMVIPVVMEIIDAVRPVVVKLLEVLMPIIQELISKILPVVNKLLEKLHTAYPETPVYNNEAVHQWNDGAVTEEPTCGTDGVRTYTCSVGGETKTEPIPATGAHVYGEEPDWIWAEDYSSATAVFTCVNDGCEHTETVTDAHPVMEEISPATATEDQVISYNATVTFQGEDYYVGTPDLTVPGTATGTPGACPFCGKVHGSGVWERLISLFHVVIYIIKTLCSAVADIC